MLGFQKSNTQLRRKDPTNPRSLLLNNRELEYKKIFVEKDKLIKRSRWMEDF